MPLDDSMKPCNRCGEWKSYDDFYKSKMTRDGYEANCKECRRARMREQYWAHEETRRKAAIKAEHVVELKRLAEQGLRRCTRCHEAKVVGEYSPRADGLADGLHSWCRQCEADDVRRSRRGLAKGEYAKYHIKEGECWCGDVHGAMKRKLWTQANVNALRAAQREYYRLDPSKKLAKNREWYYANQKERLDQIRKYQRNNPELRRAWGRQAQHLRRARMYGSDYEPLTIAQVHQHMENLGGRCIYCEGPFEHVDHFMPLALGGRHALDNLVPSCSKCNLSKKDKDPSEWVEVLKRREQPRDDY